MRQRESNCIALIASGINRKGEIERDIVFEKNMITKKRDREIHKQRMREKARKSETRER